MELWKFLLGLDFTVLIVIVIAKLSISSADGKQNLLDILFWINVILLLGSMALTYTTKPGQNQH